MYTIYVGHQKHSSWDTLGEAERQVETLINNGYKSMSIWIKHTITNYDTDDCFFV
jgi:hypothetical protein